MRKKSKKTSFCPENGKVFNNAVDNHVDKMLITYRLQIHVVTY